MKQLKITPSKMAGTISSNPSKSLSHRHLIASSLASGVSIISNVLNSEDITATKEILRNLGISIKVENSKYIITGRTFKNKNIVLNANESGSTLRFLIPLTWYIEGEHIFTGSDRLIKRSLSVYEDIARDFNYTMEKSLEETFPLKTKGKIKPGEYILDASVSSQFISGLLFVLPLLDGNSKIIFKNRVASRGYIDLTLDVLKKHNIKIEKSSDSFLIYGNQKYQPFNSNIEGDYSQAAFYLVLGLINNNVTINNLVKDSIQGDREIINIIRDFKGSIIQSNNAVTTTKSKLEASIIDLYDIPDLGPILMVMAACSKGVTKFLNVDRLKIKESNRLLAMKNNLEKMGVPFEIKNNTAYIKGVDVLKGDFVAETYNDHRIAMAMAVAASVATSPVVLDDYTVINKSYPRFFDDFAKLGGIIDEIK